VAFVAALAIAQRQRLRMERQQGALVARAHAEERAWVASELHDDILQRIAVARQELEILWTIPDRHTVNGVETRLRGINAELVDLAVAVRGIAARIHPTVVDQVGLAAAVRSLLEDLGRDGKFDLRLTQDEVAPAVHTEVSRAAYRIIQEALRNVMRHSGSRTAQVTLKQVGAELVVRIEDQGKGFNPEAVFPKSLGLAGLRERSVAVGGRTIIRSRPGVGTTVEAILPVQPPA
jgi:signal transduction histidine kinase